MITFSAFTFAACLAVLVVPSHPASTTNGKLLKFYPISKEHYNSIVALSQRQPVLSEANVFQSHRSLADWSTALSDNWNSLLGAYSNILSKNKTFEKKKVESYPICVIKTENSLHRSRSGKQYVNAADYAGVAPNVLFSRSYYGKPKFLGRKFIQPVYVEENTDDAVVVGEHIDENEDVAEENGGTVNVDTVLVPDVNGGDGYLTDKESTVPIINCVVVVRRKNKLQSLYPYPQYPNYPYPYAYPPGQEAVSHFYPPPPIAVPDQAPHFYSPVPYPYHTYPPKARHSTGHAAYRNIHVPTIDPSAVAQYQRMMAKYYRHLHALYNANAGTDLANEFYEEQQADATGETNSEKDVKAVGEE